MSDCTRVILSGFFLFALMASQPAVSEEVPQGSRDAGELAPASSVNFDVKSDYYDDGKIRSRSAFDPKGRLLGKISYYHDGGVQKEERFDMHGNRVEEAHFDSSGKLEDNLDGWAAKRWAYVDGKLRAESIYGEDGRLTERKLYNELGDLAGRQYVGDGKIDDTEEFNRGSVVTRETDSFYDAYGHRTGSVTTSVDDPDDLLPWWLYY